MKRFLIGATIMLSLTNLYFAYLWQSNRQSESEMELKLSELQDQNLSNKDKIEKSTAIIDELEDRNNFLVKNNNLLETELKEVENLLEDENDKLNPIRNVLDKVASDVATQKKLDAIDPELLQKYSRIYFLNENYVPSGISNVDQKYTIKTEQFHTRALPFLQRLLEEANQDGVNLKIVSAYRSFNRQAELKEQYITMYGSGANQFSADQGYSEHQLGTTIDFSSSENNNTLVNFENTAAYNWLINNAYKYGFVLSYPNDNQFYEFEPWHWRFVGIDLADHLHTTNKSLYEMSERELQEYRLKLFD